MENEPENLNKKSQIYFVSDKLVKDFYEERNIFTAASHLLWSIWSLVQVQNSKIEFNFVNYALIRINEYFKCKTRMI